MITALNTPYSQWIQKKKCKRGFKSIYNMAARRPPEGSELYSLHCCPTGHSALCSAALGSLSSLLDHILDCSVLSWLFDACLYLGAARQPPCWSDRHSVNDLVPPSSLSFSCLLAILPADRCPNDDSALSHY